MGLYKINILSHATLVGSEEYSDVRMCGWPEAWPSLLAEYGPEC